jgi:streptogramin lyase
VRVGSLAEHSIAIGQGGVWISDQLDDAVVEVDPRTKRIERSLSVAGPTGIAVGFGSLWVCGSDDRGVWRLQAKHGYKSPTLISTRRQPVAVAVGHGAVWTAVADGTLTRIDPRTNAAHSTKVATMLNGVAVGSDAVWAVAGPISFF